jgi:hypothetical protein
MRRNRDRLSGGSPSGGLPLLERLINNCRRLANVSEEVTNTLHVVRANGERGDGGLARLVGLGAIDLAGTRILGGELRDIQYLLGLLSLQHPEAHAANGVLLDAVVGLGELEILHGLAELLNHLIEALVGRLAVLEQVRELGVGVLLELVVIGSRHDLSRIPDVRVQALGTNGLLEGGAGKQGTDGLLGTDEVERQVVNRVG